MNEVKKNALEWMVFAASLLLIAGVFGVLIHDAVTLERRPPDVRVEVGEIKQQATNFVAPVTIRNEGDETAEDVQVEVELQTTNGEKETSEIAIPFVPRGARREGFAVFKNDARTGSLNARVKGYVQP